MPRDSISSLDEQKEVFDVRSLRRPDLSMKRNWMESLTSQWLIYFNSRWMDEKVYLIRRDTRRKTAASALKQHEFIVASHTRKSTWEFLRCWRENFSSNIDFWPHPSASKASERRSKRGEKTFSMMWEVSWFKDQFACKLRLDKTPFAAYRRNVIGVRFSLLVVVSFYTFNQSRRNFRRLSQ